MYKFSKFAIILLYPTLKLILPVLLLGVVGLSLGNHLGSPRSALSTFIVIEVVGSLVLVLSIIYYFFYATKHKLFVKNAEGKMAASVSDYFVLIFSALAVADIGMRILKIFM